MKIEIWSDFVCPFCYMGKRKLDLAIDKFAGKDNVHIEYRSYELDPDGARNPEENMHELVAQKFNMPFEKAKAMNADIAKQAEETGLVYHYDTMQQTNTFDAHRLNQYAVRQGKGPEMTERLFQAYFTDSEHIGDYETLARLAGEAGLSAEEAKDILHSGDYGKQVRADEEQAQEIGVQGVPFFVFDEEYAVSGVQSVDAFLDVLERIQEEENKKPSLKSLTPESSETTFCTDEGCEVESKEK